MPASRRPGESEELLDLAQEAGRVGIFEWQVPAATLRLSPNFLSLYGLAEFDGHYESWRDCVFREDQPRVDDLIDTAFADQQREFQVDFRIVRRSDGCATLDRGAQPHLLRRGARPYRVVGVNVDITERKRALAQLRAFAETLEEAVRERTRELEAENEARKKTEELLRQSQKMEAVGQLTGGVAHDFNNLLTVVLGGLEMIGRQLPALGDLRGAARISRGTDMALQGAQRAATLTSRLLAFSRQQPLEPKPIDANKLVVRHVRTAAAHAGRSGVARDRAGRRPLASPCRSPTSSRTRCSISAVNARDAMPDGGKLTIETANCYLDDAYVGALSEPVDAGQYVMIAVTDTGAGMDRPTLAARLRAVLHHQGGRQGHRPRPEPGLWLRAASRRACADLQRARRGHDREALSAAPFRRRGSRRAGRPGRARRPARSAPRCILVVEDDDALRGFTVEILTRARLQRRPGRRRR